MLADRPDPRPQHALVKQLSRDGCTIPPSVNDVTINTKHINSSSILNHLSQISRNADNLKREATFLETKKLPLIKLDSCFSIQRPSAVTDFQCDDTLSTKRQISLDETENSQIGTYQTAFVAPIECGASQTHYFLHIPLRGLRKGPPTEKNGQNRRPMPVNMLSAPNVIASNRTDLIGAQHEAVRETNVLQQIESLRLRGLWSAARLPKILEPRRAKVHWDFLLEEASWMAVDFIEERKWKQSAAKK
ncbi:unnamed protein product, partial [Protopolystoma xenopodis]